MINLAISTVAFLVGGISYFLLMIATLGYAASIAFKEVFRQNEYLFYRNNGLSKIRLLVCAFLFNFAFVLLLVLTLLLIHKIS